MCQCHSFTYSFIPSISQSALSVCHMTGIILGVRSPTVSKTKSLLSRNLHSNRAEQQAVKNPARDFPAGQWLRVNVPTIGGMGSIPGQVTKILYATWHSEKQIKKATTKPQPNRYRIYQVVRGIMKTYKDR